MNVYLKGTNRLDITNRQFGKLIALSPSGFKDIGKHGRVTSIWKCKCLCGNELNVATTHLISNHTRSCGKCYRNVHNKEQNRRIALIKRLFTGKIRTRCNQANLSYSLSLDDFEKIILCECFYCGRKDSLLIRDLSRNGKKLISNEEIKHNGIDRIDSNKGYHKDNCVACCWDCNTAKWDMPISEFLDLIKRIYQNWASK